MLTSVDIHRSEAPRSVTCMVITISDTRTRENDQSGKIMMNMLVEAGFDIMGYAIVADDYTLIQQAIHQSCAEPQVEAILLNGGTGITKRDTTYEAVRDLLDKKMHGFGEIFRYLSFTEDIGTAAILSRAVAGVCNNKAIFSMPGSSGAVKLALGRIIIPELRHVMREIYKDI